MKAYIPQVENAMVTAILREAKVFDLLLKNEITRMPVIPTANYDDNPEMIEISSSEDEEDEVEEPEDDPSSPPARGSRMERKLQVKQTLGLTISTSMKMKRTWGADLLRQRNAELKFEASVISLTR